MQITQELQLVYMDDIGVFAEARDLVRLVKDVVAAARTESPLLAYLRRCVQSLAELVADGLRAGEAIHEIMFMRQAKIALAALRCQTWAVFDQGLMSTPMFDDLMRTSARCLQEICATESASRRRAIARIELRPLRSRPAASGSLAASGVPDGSVRNSGQPRRITQELPMLSDWPEVCIEPAHSRRNTNVQDP